MSDVFLMETSLIVWTETWVSCSFLMVVSSQHSSTSEQGLSSWAGGYGGHDNDMMQLCMYSKLHGCVHQPTNQMIRMLLSNYRISRKMWRDYATQLSPLSLTALCMSLFTLDLCSVLFWTCGLSSKLVGCIEGHLGVCMAGFRRLDIRLVSTIYWAIARP